MYKNLTYYNKYKSIKKYENKLLGSYLFGNITKTKEGKQEIVYKTPEVLISINKSTVNFLVFNNKKFALLENIEKFSEML